MGTSREARAVAAAVRCYPARWRARHGDEALLLASSLLDDGVSLWSIFWSLLGGASRERLLRRPSLRVGTTLAAAAVGLAAAPLALFAWLTPASASGTDVAIVVSRSGDVARQLEASFANHHFRLAVTERSVSAGLAGSILAVKSAGGTGATADVVGELHGPCFSGESGCIDGIVLPLHFSGTAEVTIGRLATPTVGSTR